MRSVILNLITISTRFPRGYDKYIGLLFIQHFTTCHFKCGLFQLYATLVFIPDMVFKVARGEKSNPTMDSDDYPKQQLKIKAVFYLPLEK